VQITKVVRVYSDDNLYIAFINAKISNSSPAKRLRRMPGIKLDWAEGYANIFEIPKGTLFIEVWEAKDELDAMKIAIEVMETEDFKAYYKEYRAE